MTQPAAASAVAMPASAMRGKSVSASATFTATEMPAKSIGVRVSSRAKKPGMKTLIMTKAGRPRPKIARAPRRRRGRRGREGAALEEDAHDLLRDQRQRGRGREREEQREFERPVLVVLRLAEMAGLQRARQLRQQHDADGDADDAERQLVDAVGILQDGDGAFLRRGDDLPDEQG